MGLVKVRHIAPAYEAQTLWRPEQTIDGRIAQMPSAWGFDILPSCQAIQRIHHAAVGNQHDLLAKVLTGQFVHAATNALTQGGE